MRRALPIVLALLLSVLTVPVASAGPTDLVAIAEQSSKRILVLPADQAAWTAGDYAWEWAPSEANGLGDLVDAWVHPDEAKLATRDGQQYLLTTASGGFAGVIPYPAGTDAYWAADVVAANNPHSIELLPDGNVAVAASTGGWLRVYTASQGPRSTAHAEFPLTGAHGAVWDGDVLWALGTHELVALRVGGTPDAPTLTPEREIALPSEGGHDLQPVPGAGDLLWVSTHDEVLQFSKAAGTFSTDYAGAAEVNRANVKSVTTHSASGQILSVTPKPGHECTWCTDTVDLAVPSGSLTLPGGWIYKARWWEPTMQ
jgi:uncharacterized protein DUF6528